MNTTALATAIAERHDLDPLLAGRIADYYASVTRRRPRPELLNANGEFATEVVLAEVGDSLHDLRGRDFTPVFIVARIDDGEETP